MKEKTHDSLKGRKTSITNDLNLIKTEDALSITCKRFIQKN